MRRLVLSLVLISTAAYADEPNFVRAEKLVLERLTDPDSAKFRRLVAIGNDKTIVCGQVNSKNQFGGYTGFKTFMVMLNLDKPSSVTIEGVDDGPVGIDLASGICGPHVAPQQGN
jgi:hypothetical protein